jgi:two-component system LytT family response regulator
LHQRAALFTLTFHHLASLNLSIALPFMDQLTAIIVEDEALGLQNLQAKLARNCPQVNVVATCQSGEEAIQAIQAQQPELLLLDIQLGTMTGFDVLARLRHLSFEVIFTTSYDEYAIDAIRANALDYLLKPIDEGELVEAINKAWQKRQQRPQDFTRIPLPVQHGYRFVGIDEIEYCQADNKQTIVHLFSRQQVTTPRTLSQIEDKLASYPRFRRVHRSFLINLDFAESFSRRDGNHVIMACGERLPVTRPEVLDG